MEPRASCMLGQILYCWGYEVSSSDEKVLEQIGAGCTTVNILKAIELCTLNG
jgi:hypothetical protein